MNDEIDKLKKLLDSSLIRLKEAKEKNKRIIEPIAIIGMSCQFPGSDNVDEFWTSLAQGKDGISEVPASRWNINEYFDANPDAPGKMITRKAGFIENVDLFDANFFNISPREAEYLDPQQRLLLTHTWIALENAGIASDGLFESNTGVFVGIATQDYNLLLNKYSDPKERNAYLGTGNALSTATGRISYIFGLQGPNMAIDTACSSSLVALHEACKSLQRGECDLAISGGVSALLAPELFIDFSKAGMLAPDGHCKTFDEKADGYARGEGCGMVILKRLSDAQRDNDTVLAVIKATGVNQDGASSGLTVPNGEAQVKLLNKVLAEAKLSAQDIDYIECHGTGTRLGDPIEVHAIGSVYGVRDKNNPLKLGSVKPNIGHLEAASGVAGLIKTILALQYHELPKQLHFHILNPHITMDFPAEIVTENKAWESRNPLRHAAISSFGFSGTNAHIILEEAPVREPITDEEESGNWVIRLSAKTQNSLNQLIHAYIEYIESHPEVSIKDIVYTANAGRAVLELCMHFKATTRDELLKNLKQKEVTSEPEHTPVVGSKIALPTYCFEQTRYWLKSADAAESSDTSSWCYSQTWELLNSRLSNRDPLAEFLVLAFNKKTLITWSEILSQSTSSFALVSEVESGKKAIEGRVIILCDGKDSMREDLLSIIKLMVKQKSCSELLVITQRTQILDSDFIDEHQLLSSAPLLGFFKSLQIELPFLNIKLIDVEDLLEIKSNQQLIKDFNAIPSDEVILVARKQKYYVPRIIKQKLPSSTQIKMNPEAIYLITGGLGGLGQVIVQWLIDSGAKHLVVTGRTAPKSNVQEQINQWQKEQIDIQIHSVDASDKDSVKLLIEGLKQSRYPLRGIFHLAGIQHQDNVLDINPDEMKQVFGAKVYGSYYLHELTKDLTLDYFVLFSSIAAFIGSQKQSLYAAANHYLNQLALYRQAQKLPALCIDWGPWGNTGMASRHYSLEQLNALGLHPSDLVSAQQARALLSTLLSHPLSTQLINTAFVSPHYLRFMLDFMPSPIPAWIKGIKAQLPQPKVIGVLDTQILINRLLSLTVEARKKELQMMVCKEVAQVLGLDNSAELSRDKGFFDLGMDSIMAVELQKRLQAQLGNGIELKANLSFDYPTIEAMRDYLYEQLFGEGILLAEEKVVSFSEEPIAVIGMSCRFPGHANTPEQFWNLLATGGHGITEVPKSRWDMDQYYDPDPEKPGKSYTRYGAFIDDIEFFDPAFFNISPREAQTMDPQQRLLLEVSYNALQNAGYTLEHIKGSQGGVFVGVGANEYGGLLNQSSSLDAFDAYFATGNALNVIAGRLSYTYGLEGPSEVVDTACSSSLVAIHHAVHSLRQHECSFALVGGVNAMIRPETFVMLSKAKMLSPDGQCKTFDERANGYVRGEGCGVLVLKRLSDALRDSETILAVIKGSAVNQDGASSGLTVPRGPAQQAVIERALLNAQLNGADIDYVEAHGTGTGLGDPIEVTTLAQTYGTTHTPTQPFLLGTVKTNIGHLESAAGIAGVIKVILSLQNQCIPAHLHFNQLNPHIDLAAAHAQLPLSLMPWKSTETVRRAAVSSFGFSGTNAHMILEEAPEPIQTDEIIDLPQHLLFVLSAKTQKSLDELVQSYIHYLEHSSERLEDICYSVAISRDHFNHRLALVVSDKDDLLNQLTTQKGICVEVSSADEVISSDSPHELSTQYLLGKRIDWQNYYKPYFKALRKVSLPTYCFDRQRYWIEVQAGDARNNSHPFLQHESFNIKEEAWVFTTNLDEKHPDFLSDHQIYGEVVIAGAGYISAMMSFAFQVLQRDYAVLQDIEFIQPLVIPHNTKRVLQITVQELQGDYVFEIYSIAEQMKSDVTVHATGRLKTSEQAAVEFVSIEALKEQCLNTYFGDLHQANAARYGLTLGSHFHWLNRVFYNDHELLAELRPPADGETLGCELYPGLIDSSFQAALVWLARKGN